MKILITEYDDNVKFKLFYFKILYLNVRFYKFGYNVYNN